MHSDHLVSQNPKKIVFKSLSDTVVYVVFILIVPGLFGMWFKIDSSKTLHGHEPTLYRSTENKNGTDRKLSTRSLDWRKFQCERTIVKKVMGR